MHKNKLWWWWDVEGLKAPEGLAGASGLRSLPALGTPVLTPTAAPWPCLGPSHGSRWWCWGRGPCLPPLPVPSLAHIGCVGAAFNAFFSKLYNLWCSHARVKAGIHLCCKCCVWIKRLLWQSAPHGKKQWDTARTHLVRTRGGGIWIIKTNIHAPRMPLGRAGRNGRGKHWHIMFAVLFWKMPAHQFSSELRREKFGCWGVWKRPSKTLCTDRWSRWRAELKWYLGGEEENTS